MIATSSQAWLLQGGPTGDRELVRAWALKAARPGLLPQLCCVLLYSLTKHKSTCEPQFLLLANESCREDVSEVPRPVPGTCEASTLGTPSAWTGSSALARGRGRPDEQSTELSLANNSWLAQEYQVVCQQLWPGKLRAEAAGRPQVGLLLPKGLALRAPLSTGQEGSS